MDSITMGFDCGNLENIIKCSNLIELIGKNVDFCISRSILHLYYLICGLQRKSSNFDLKDNDNESIIKSLLLDIPAEGISYICTDCSDMVVLLIDEFEKILVFKQVETKGN